MSKPIITIHNAETGEITTREMNAAELAQYQADQAVELARLETEAIKATAKTAAKAKLATLGLTAEDLKALGL